MGGTKDKVQAGEGIEKRDRTGWPDAGRQAGKGGAGIAGLALLLTLTLSP
jgi:hypothetical protein